MYVLLHLYHFIVFLVSAYILYISSAYVHYVYRLTYT